MAIPKSVHNRHRVPKKQWSKWGDTARRTFNEVMTRMRSDQENYLHPKTKKVPQVQWITTCWNAAWEAAEVVNGAPKPEQIVTIDLDLKRLMNTLYGVVGAPRKTGA